jgi:tetratricopeptide (TPR) repeat protein
MLDSSEPISLFVILKNIGFLLKNAPFAAKKAEEHIKNSINIAKEIGAIGVLGQAYLSLGRLHNLKKRTDPAKECISKAIEFFEQCEAEVYLKQANEVFESLE